MGALIPTVPTRAGTTTNGQAVAATDTIARAVMGAKGCLLKINNGGGVTDNMTISDAGTTPAGTPPGTYPGVVANAAAKIFVIDPSQVDLSTGFVTITHSSIATVTYELYPIN